MILTKVHDQPCVDFLLLKTEGFLNFFSFFLPRMVVQIYNPSTQEVEAGKLLIAGWPSLHSNTLFQETKGWGYGLLVNCLCSMYKTLGFITSTKTKKKERKKTTNPDRHFYCSWSGVHIITSSRLS
jgi:hypothetical protein